MSKNTAETPSSVNTKYIFALEGLDCPDCAAHVEKAVSRLSGIRSASVVLATQKLTISGTSDIDLGGVKRAVESLGYGISEETPAKKVDLLVQGMDCQDEVELIEKRLTPLAGVVGFEANVMSQKVTVTYYPENITTEDIIRELGAVGLKATAEKPKAKAQGKPWWKEPKLILLVLSGLITLSTVIADKLGLPQQTVKIFFGLAIVLGSYYPAKMGFAALKNLTINIRLLMVAGALGAVSLGQWEEAALLVFIYLLGDVLEAFAVDKARGSIRALMELAPSEALVKRDGGETVLAVDEIRIGDILIVKPGERVPLDGTVVLGSSTVDQAPITGESIPAAKNLGDEVFAGTINQRGSLEIKVTQLAKDTTLARIIHLVEEAQAKKSKYQRFGEKFGKYYTPSMFALAIGVAFVPSFAFGQDFSTWYLRGLVVLVVSCSCGLALSVPVSVVTAIGNAARHGVIIKGGAYLEAASGIDVVAFDKTGTLTIGQPEVTDIISLNNYSIEEILKVAGAIESRSEHPLADAILKEAENRDLSLPEINDFQSVTGLGARAKVDGHIYRIGNREFFKEFANLNDIDAKTLAKLENQGKTTVLLGSEKGLLGAIAVADQLRPHIEKTIADLKAIGIKRVVMLTGDNERTAGAIAAQAGVDEYFAELLPDDKVEAVKKLKKSYGKVAMVGDGVNDAPAMAVADVGIAMGGGTDVALETGDMALMADELPKLSYALRLSQRSVRNIKQNIAASLAIVAFLVPAALVGFVGLVPGILINEVSALIVIVNGLRLLWARFEKEAINV
ncbi:MAG: cadmium-translocating P-type ATPase [Actinobacteria bacterium]|nr:cadmium-translocating P-type ATPase [Actinomycetota bacterium]